MSGFDSGRSGLGSFSAKAFVAGIVIFGGIAGGIYTGTALSGGGSGSPSPESLSNNSYLNIGETFPDYALSNQALNLETSISRITANGPALLVFVGAGCGACRTMAAIWKKREIVGLRDDIKIVLIYDSEELMREQEAGELLDIPGALTLGSDRGSQRDDDGILSTPTFIAIDENREIQFVVSGFRRDLGSKYVNEHL